MEKTMNQNFNNIRHRSIGTVEFVSPKEIKVILETDAPLSTTLNTGVPQLFPRINGILLIPNEAGALIGMITWIGIEYSPYPKRKGYKDFDLVDLPFPLRKLSLTPLGILKEKDGKYEIERGVYSYPSVGDIVIVPSQEQLKAIVQNKDENARIKIGVSPMAANAPVFVYPDKLFGRHLAILGNTGSGKSCSVAGLIRWSIESAKNEITENNKSVNARFIIFDPNGEYGNCFESLGYIKKYEVKIKEKGDNKQLKVPSWMWNSWEWASIAQASAKSQIPAIKQFLIEQKKEDNNNQQFDEDTPIFFDHDKFIDKLKSELKKDYNQSFLMRLDILQKDSRLKSVIKSEKNQTLENWLNEYIGNNDNNPSITIIDLSLLPFEILFLVVSVMARIIFEAHHRYKKQTGQTLPTVLVVDEAHNLMKRFEKDDDNISSQRLCTQIFEKIAKEGRKFGVGLVLASQRPSELSQTVLSQCNTFLLHRIVSDRDQEMVKKLVPDTMGGILNELSVLPSRKAILLGWATPLPILVEMNELAEEQRPKSKDPEFWNVWINNEERSINWKSIANEWQQLNESSERKNSNDTT
jgi:DNA helicase HerA-like ATPase